MTPLKDQDVVDLLSYITLSHGARQSAHNDDEIPYELVKKEWVNLNVLPVIGTINPEIVMFLAALNKQKEVQRLFQFLNGLEGYYSHQRSQILMIVPLPNMESAGSLIQQEESQRLLFGSASNVESTTLYNRVSFYPKFCVVQDLTTRKVRGLGKLKEGLYHLVNVPADKNEIQDTENKSRVKTLEINHVTKGHVFRLEYQLGTTQQASPLRSENLDHHRNKSVKDSYGLWHHRLGHVSDAKLKHMHDLLVSLSKSCLDNCLSCPMVKFTKLPYSLSESHIDDCSRGTWIYYLEQKYDSFEALKSFIKFVATPFEKQVKIVRPHQNGRVVRKHRHILDTTRALRFHSKLPLEFWGDCVTTATYLINRLPSSVVGNITPYEILLNKKLVYDHLRVFGCFAMVSNPSRTTDKFDPRGVPRVFLDSIKNFLIPLPTTFACISQVTNDWEELYCDPVIPTEQSHSTTIVQKDPVNFKEVVADLGWCTAMDAELKALDENSTWELTSLPAGKKAIDSHWIFKTKLKADGTVDRKKARLIVQGNRQRHGIDYQETFAPVAQKC
ncbi:retrovirus-related pol polyprotein from transposon TNT 1-94 [Tanacetum coccineum]